LIIVALLTGCAKPAPFSPLTLGISEVEWGNYDAAEREKMIANYNRVTLANTIEDQNTRELALVNQINNNTVESIEVRLSGGSALMPPFITQKSLAPATTTIALGTCKNTRLVQLDGATETTLRSCYKVNQEDKKIFYLDPSYYDQEKQHGTVTIPYSPLWNSENGFTYHGINSSGHVQLRDVSVAIKKSHNS